MKYSHFFLIMLFPCIVSAQQKRTTLTDTIEYIIEKVHELSNQDKTYEMFRLNFDDCNLEIHQTFTADSSRWNIYSFWISDLDKNKLRLINQPHGGWALILNSYRSKIRYNTEESSGYRKSVVFLSEKRDLLLHLGEAIYFAASECQKQGRGKNK